VKKKLKILALFDAIAPTTLDQDLSPELATPDWQTEAHVLTALRELGHPTEYLAIFDNLDLLQQKLQSFQPDLIFNLADQFKNNRAFDQNIVSFMELHGVPFTGCGSTGLTLCKHKAISKKILGYHRIHVPEFTVIARGKRISRPARLKFPVLIKPLKEEARPRLSKTTSSSRSAWPSSIIRGTATSSPRNTSKDANSTSACWATIGSKSIPSGN
jgi:D-alanine-D-alanine ligase